MEDKYKENPEDPGGLIHQLSDEGPVRFLSSDITCTKQLKDHNCVHGKYRHDFNNTIEYRCNNINENCIHQRFPRKCEEPYYLEDKYPFLIPQALCVVIFFVGIYRLLFE